MLARLLRQTDHALASLTAAVNVSFSVADTVALEAEKCLNALDRTQKVCVFLTPFVKILGKIAIYGTAEYDAIKQTRDQLGYTLQKEADDENDNAYEDLAVVKRIDAVASLHKLPYPLAKRCSLFHSDYLRCFE